MKRFLTTLIALTLGFSVLGADFYVCQSAGKKKGPGTKEAPFRTIYDAVKNAQPGDAIHVAAGSYTGKMGASEIIIEKPVTIIGGYSPGFTERNVTKYPTMIQPVNEKNDTKGLGLLTFDLPELHEQLSRCQGQT
jgi:hypothetical protein